MIDTTKLVTAEQKLQAAKVAKNLEINAWRLGKNKTTFTYTGKQIACDDLSKADITAANNEITNHNALPANWLGAWKAVDNTYVVIDSVVTWKQFYSAMFNQGTINFSAAQTLKNQLSLATTLAQVNAIVMP